MSLLFPRVDSMNKSGYPTKTCSSCGQRKPLSAFLQLAAPHTYGNTCSDCRKTTIDSSETTKEDEGTRSTTGVKIDAKTKVQHAADKREFDKQVDDSYHEGRDKNEELNIERSEKTTQTAGSERKHREDQEKRSLQESQKKPSISPSSIAGGEAEKAEAGKIELAAGPVEVSRVSTAKLHSSIYQSHLRRLGTAAPQAASVIEKTAEQNQNKDNKAAPAAASATPTAQNNNKEKEPAKTSSWLPAFRNWMGNAPVVSTAEKMATEDKNKTTPASDPASEYIHRNSGPKGR